MRGAGFTSDDHGGPIEASDLGPERWEEEKRRARDHPGASWKEWLYFTAFRWWMGIAFLIVDTWIVTIFLVPRQWVFLALSILPAVYLEYLLYGYLWRRPGPTTDVSRSRRVRWPPYEVGRWTPEGFQLRAGVAVEPAEPPGPDPREFL